jgi:endo-1,4-beta-xylanase
MVSFSSLFLSLSAAAAITASPLTLGTRSGTASSEGASGGYFYSFWTDGNSDVTYTNGALGEYSISWDGDGDFVGGKGWSTGSAQ